MTQAQSIEAPDDFLYAEIVKSESQADGSVIVYGRPSQDVVDIDDQIADKEWLKQALPEWFTSFANIREMHGPKAVGTGQRLEFDENDDPWVTAKIVDRDAAQKVREGVYKGFSIGIRKPILKRDAQAKKGRFVGGKIIELSVVDRPAVPTAKFDIVKAAGANKWIDCQTGFVLADVTKDASFDEEGNPILQPGHVRDEGEFRIVEVGDTTITVEVDGELMDLPYELDASGSYVFGAPQPLIDPEAKGDDPMDTGKAVSDTEEVTKAVWSTEYVDNLPDSSFAYISPGGKKDDDGKTTPRSLRHLPYKDSDGKADAAHVRNALARLDQTDIPAKAKQAAKKKLETAAKEVDVEVSNEQANKAAEIVKAAEDAMKNMAYCNKCETRVKLGDKADEEKGAGGKHVTYKGDCGHMVKKFEKGDETKAPEADETKGEQKPEETPDEKPEETKGAQTAPAAVVDADVIKSAVFDAVKELLGQGAIPAAPDSQKSADVRVQQIDAIKAAYAKLGDFVEKISAAPDASKAAIAENGGPTPVDFDVLNTQVREGLSEFSELARLLLNTDGPLVHDTKRAGDLGPTNKPVAPETKPAGETYDLVHVGDAMKQAMADVAKTFGTTLQEVVNPLRERLERIEHMPSSVTKAEVYVAENPGVFGQSQTQITKAARQEIRQRFTEMSPKEQEEFTQRLIAAARGGR